MEGRWGDEKGLGGMEGWKDGRKEEKQKRRKEERLSGGSELGIFP